MPPVTRLQLPGHWMATLSPLSVGAFVIAARSPATWEVVAVDAERKIVDVIPVPLHDERLFTVSPITLPTPVAVL